MPELPLKIRTDIRDLWDSPTADLNNSVEAVTTTLGHKMAPQVQWPQLYDALKGHFPEKSTFVPFVARIAISLYRRLLSKLDTEGDSDWTDNLLGVLAKKSSWVVNIEVSSLISRPRLIWRDGIGAFYLEIPNKEPVLQAMVDAGFDSDLENLFSQGSAPPNGDDWADITEVGTQSIQESIPAPREGHPLSAPAVEKLPTVEALARPADLFKTNTPYFLIIDAGSRPFAVQGSHQPSLELLAAYLKKWAKANMNDSTKHPVLDVTLVESAFFFGVVDALTIEPFSNFRTDGILNPALVLAFVEGVLGYQLVHTTGHLWVYKSEKVFR